MAVYQVSVVFNAVDDDAATFLAERIQQKVARVTTGEHEELYGEAKIAFTKFEKEAPEVASE